MYLNRVLRTYIIRIARCKMAIFTLFAVVRKKKKLFCKTCKYLNIIPAKKKKIVEFNGN